MDSRKTLSAVTAFALFFGNVAHAEIDPFEELFKSFEKAPTATAQPSDSTVQPNPATVGNQTVAPAKIPQEEEYPSTLEGAVAYLKAKKLARKSPPYPSKADCSEKLSNNSQSMPGLIRTECFPIGWNYRYLIFSKKDVSQVNPLIRSYGIATIAADTEMASKTASINGGNAASCKPSEAFLLRNSPHLQRTFDRIDQSSNANGSLSELSKLFGKFESMKEKEFKKDKKVRCAIDILLSRMKTKDEEIRTLFSIKGEAIASTVQSSLSGFQANSIPKVGTENVPSAWGGTDDLFAQLFGGLSWANASQAPSSAVSGQPSAIKAPVGTSFVAVDSQCKDSADEISQWDEFVTGKTKNVTAGKVGRSVSLGFKVSKGQAPEGFSVSLSDPLFEDAWARRDVSVSACPNDFSPSVPPNCRMASQKGNGKIQVVFSGEGCQIAEDKTYWVSVRPDTAGKISKFNLDAIAGKSSSTETAVRIYKSAMLTANDKSSTETIPANQAVSYELKLDQLSKEWMDVNFKETSTARIPKDIVVSKSIGDFGNPANPNCSLSSVTGETNFSVTSNASKNFNDCILQIGTTYYLNVRPSIKGETASFILKAKSK